MSDNGYTTLEDLMEAINRVENDHGQRLDEIVRGQTALETNLTSKIESVLAASETAHKEIISRLDRLENGGE